MGLVNDEDTVLRQDGRSPGLPMEGVRQQEVVVADLEQIPAGAAQLQEAQVAALVPVAVTAGLDMDPLPVIAAHR